jgi:RNA polymerase sigma factor (sigma-70 family)
MWLLAGASDERLVALAHAGDEQAFAGIVERYRAPLLRYCRGFVSSGAAAEDAVQQTFINAYAALSHDDASRVPATLRPWLYRIAHNAALNVARDPQAGFDELPEGLDGVERPDEVVAARERFRRVIGAVSALPPKQRQVIVRHAVDGDSHERIATDLGMSAGSIRQLAHRARRTVREAAAALLPGPLLRVLPFGSDAAEVLPAAGGGAVLAKVAVVVVAAGAAGGGAVVAKHDTAKPATAKSNVHPAPVRTPVPTPPAATLAPLRAGGGSSSGTAGSTRGGEGSGSSTHGSSGSGKSGSSDSSGSGSSGSGSDSSGSGSTGSGSGSGSSGSGSSGSGSGSSGSGTSGSGTSGSSTSDSGSSGSGSSGSGTSGSGTSGSSGSDSFESSGKGSSGSDD